MPCQKERINIGFYDGRLSPNLGVAPVAKRMNDGDLWYAWVDYDGTTNGLEVRLGESQVRPVAPLVSAVVDLPSVLGKTNAFVGFTSGTGGAYGHHDILSWEFRDNFDPIGRPPSNGVPEGGITLLGFGLALSGLGLIRRWTGKQ